MKTIRICFLGFDSNVTHNFNIILDILKKRYIVEICDNADYADYVFCSLFGFEDNLYSNGILHAYCNFPQVRILLSGENYVPDFNLADYAISSYKIDFFDRHYSCPCLVPAFFQDVFEHFRLLKNGVRTFTKADLEKKSLFATFLANHESEYGIRGDFFKKLSEYKFVASPGSLYHNTDEKIVWTDDSKCKFVNKGKFSLCFESTKHEGFITEKIVDAFYANTIPVYYGSSNVSEIFNTKAFINCNDYDSFEDAIKAIIEIDNDDEKYIKMMQEPIFVNQNYQKELIDGLEKFLYNIFDQPLEKAYRRSRIYSPKHFDYYISVSQKYMSKFVFPYLKIVEKIKNGPKRFLKRIISEDKYNSLKQKIRGKLCH